MVRSAAFDPEAWEGAREVLKGDLPLDPSDLDGEVMSEMALRLSEVGWTYREIAAALGVGKSTVGRWLGPSPASDQANESPGGGLVGLLLGAGAVAVILRSVLGKKPGAGSAGLGHLRPTSRDPDVAPDPASETTKDGNAS